jgi:hypothetical protein
MSQDYMGCPTSGVAQRTMKWDAPHARGVSKARQNPMNCSEPFSCPLFVKMTLTLDV